MTLDWLSKPFVVVFEKYNELDTLGKWTVRIVLLSVAFTIGCYGYSIIRTPKVVYKTIIQKEPTHDTVYSQSIVDGENNTQYNTNIGEADNVNYYKK